MGLFDEVVSDYELPGWPEDEESMFQTKDLGCGMESYRITSDGTRSATPRRASRRGS